VTPSVAAPGVTRPSDATGKAVNRLIEGFTDSDFHIVDATTVKARDATEVSTSGR